MSEAKPAVTETQVDKLKEQGWRDAIGKWSHPLYNREADVPNRAGEVRKVTQALGRDGNGTWHFDSDMEDGFFAIKVEDLDDGLRIASQYPARSQGSPTDQSDRPAEWVKP